MPGVYISFPFCAQKCSFCNFASGVHSRDTERAYYDALLAEIGSHPWEWTPDTVYLGGGTPSNMDLPELARVLRAIPGTAWSEATLEAAPGTITRDKAEAWKRAGITRVSLGVQSFHSMELAKTGRRHSAQTVVEDCATLRAAGIEDLNIDLIAGLPHQTASTWAESLEWIERLDPPHVSVYMFEIDEDSRLGLEVLNNGARYGANAVPSDELAAELYETAVDRLAVLGIPRYEISNFATPGRESLHNLKYWTMQPYVGFGVDAHSFDGRTRVGNTESVADYIRGKVEVSRSDANVDEERIFTGLRLTKGLEFGPTEWQRHRAVLERFLDAGLLETESGVVRLTRRGVLLSNEVFQEFLAA
ncbi:MAG TPA: coproporphyrinogen-III oxidase family protein [Bryobacteraceae bacterium]|nr:coproporphyrinogen-III oxidase family protein [Bryobacteraceae bacterium]